MADNASKDQNRVSTLLGVSSIDLHTPISLYADPTTHGLILDGPSLYAQLDPRYLGGASSSNIYKNRVTTINNPYVSKSHTYKGQIHCHTTNSDGVDTPTALVTAYKNAGYDFINVSDHNVITADPSVSGILYIAGVEEDGSGGSTHLLRIQATTVSVTPDPQARITHSISDGDSPSFIAHPSWSSSWSNAQIESVSGEYGFEVYNAGTATNSETQYDVILSKNKKLMATSVDDCHNIADPNQFNRTSIVVNSDSLTTANIMMSIKRGNFYSRYTPVGQTDVTMSVIMTGNVLSVSTLSGSTIELISKGSVIQTSTNVSSTTYTMVGNEMYVRVKITNGTAIAWSNPIYVNLNSYDELYAGGAINGNLYEYGKLQVTQPNNERALYVLNNNNSEAITVNSTNSTNKALYLYSNQGATQAQPLADFYVDNVANTKDVINIHNDGTGNDINAHSFTLKAGVITAGTYNGNTIGSGSTSGTNTGDQTGGTPALVLGTANTAGTSTNFIRRDDTILTFDATSPSTQAFGDSALVGTATVAARRDHKHAMMAAPTTITGNAGTATKLAATKTINGVSFDGSANITVPSDITPSTSGNVLTSNGSVWTSAPISVPTEAANTDINIGIDNAKFLTSLALAGSYIYTDGWLPARETWTYVSADGNTGVFNVAADVTTKYSVGMRVKYTQTTVKYGIITVVGAYAAGVTPITIWGGTDYTFANTAVSLNYFSREKSPFGFPLDPTKWTVETLDTSIRIQATPTAGTWYNIGSNSIILPIGLWKVSYQVCAQLVIPVSLVDEIFVTLSTGNNSQTDTGLTSYNVCANLNIAAQFYREKVLSMASKTTYYLNTMHSQNTTATNMYNRGDNIPTTIRALCAYL